MGKRSEFKRIERDYYRTFDPKAGEILKPFIEHVICYAEPFAGKGDLIRNLKENGVTAKCTIFTDIEPQDDQIKKFDAFDLTKEDLLYSKVDAVISNPPWTREILHRAIEHFAPKTETWFLLDANWLFTKQASPYIRKWLTDVVTIGRLKWIEGTKMTGKDDCCWMRFCFDKEEPTRFYGRD